MKNSFSFVVEESHNLHVQAIIDLAIELRMQVTASQAMRAMSGWGDGFNDYLKDRIADMLNACRFALEQRRGEVPLPGLAAVVSIAYDLTGADPNIPQPTFANMQNSGLRWFVVQLDAFVRMTSQFDSRNFRRGLMPLEVEQAKVMLDDLYAICEEYGGDENVRSVISPILPADIDNTFNAAGQFDVETVGRDLGNRTPYYPDTKSPGGRGPQGSGVARQQGFGNPGGGLEARADSIARPSAPPRPA